VLEVGAGLGVVGLALAKQCPWLHVTLSDYDTEIVENLERNAALNFASPRPEHTLDVAALDFRDFTPASIDKAPLPQCLQQHADAGLYGQVDLLLGADVVYEKTHCQLAHVCLALLAPHTDERRPPPCAVFFSNISRPYIRDFVAGLDAAGLSCRIERVTPSEALARRLRRTHEGWGVGAIFCMFHVTRRPPVAVEVD
jgi:predicted nicotinamide N-methyase